MLHIVQRASHRFVTEIIASVGAGAFATFTCGSCSARYRGRCPPTSSDRDNRGQSRETDPTRDLLRFSIADKSGNQLPACTRHASKKSRIGNQTVATGPAEVRNSQPGCRME